MNIKTCQRDKRPQSWYIGRRLLFGGSVWELADIEEDKYHWIWLRHKQPGETIESVNQEGST